MSSWSYWPVLGVHRGEPRGRAVFVPVNCAVLGDELFESELFGHASGAFTGAAQDRKGLLELSSGGTVFLGEVAELTPRAQAKLLRVLQDGEVRRLGENRTRRLDLRVVAATNRPLDAEASAGRFRKNLLYRLGVLGLTAPPLRDRGPDVARLTDHCWKEIAAAAGSRATLARETVAALAAHPWPGNAERWPTLAEAREDLERTLVRDALGRQDGVARAAAELGITRQGLSKLMARLRIDQLDPGRDCQAQAPSR